MKFRQQYIFLGVIVCIVVASALGVWLQFPIIAPLHGIERRDAGLGSFINILAVPYLISFAIAVFALLINRKLIGELLLGVSLTALFAVPALMMTVDTSLMATYIDNCIQYEKFQFITIFLGHTPTSSGNPYLINAGNFHYLTDRGFIALKMLGWGWYLCLIGTVVVAVFMRRMGKLQSLQRFFLAVLVFVAPLIVMGFGAIRADFNYREGDQRLGLGDYAGAINSYSLAFDKDPMLRDSRVFLNNFSKAYYQLGNASNSRGQLYLASISESKFDGFNSLLRVESSADGGAPLDVALGRMARRVEIDWLLTQSLRAYKNEEYGTALIALRRAISINQDMRHVRYLLAKVLMRLQEFDEAGQHLEMLLSTVNEKSIMVTLYNSLGDVQSAAGHADVARQYYLQSYKLSKSKNLWAIKGLGGT